MTAQPTPPRTLLRDSAYFREMSEHTADPAEAHLWLLLAREVDAYLAAPDPGVLLIELTEFLDLIDRPPPP